MSTNEKTVCRLALMQIWETIYDHDVGKYAGTDSKLQRQAAFDNIKLLERLLADEPVH
tara:strand:- start:613 stop:786 length:174 start_codon:yes stop_codon:yes gene_type:complete